MYDQVGSDDASVLAEWLRARVGTSPARLRGGYAEWIEHSEPIIVPAPPEGARYVVGQQVERKAGGAPGSRKPAPAPSTRCGRRTARSPPGSARMSFVVSLLGLVLRAPVIAAFAGLPPRHRAPLGAAGAAGACGALPGGRAPGRASIGAPRGTTARAAWYYEAWLAQKGGSARTRAAVPDSRWASRCSTSTSPTSRAACSPRCARAARPSRRGAPGTRPTPTTSAGATASRRASARPTAPPGPTDEHADECLVLIGDAWVAAGESGAAIAAYNTYLEKHPDTPREETLRLGIALAVTNGSPAQGIPMLQNLAARPHLPLHRRDSASPARRAREGRGRHRAARHGRHRVSVRGRAQAVRVRDRGVGEIPIPRRARPGQSASWPSWVEAQQERFAWSTKQYDIVAAQLAEQYAKKPDAETAWQRYRALARGGQWAAAVDQLQAGQKTHGGSGRFRSVRVEVARGQLLAGRYTDAVGSFTELGKSGGAFGKEAKWLAAYAAFRAGHVRRRAGTSRRDRRERLR